MPLRAIATLKTALSLIPYDSTSKKPQTDCSIINKSLNNMVSKKKNSPLLLFPTHYLGNFVLGLPWLCEIASSYPDTTIVIDSAFTPLLNMTSAKSARVVEYPRAALDKSKDLFSRGSAYIKFLNQLRRHDHDCLIDMEGERFTGVLSLLSGCPTRLGPNQKHGARFYTNALELDYEKHRFNAFGQLIAQWQHIETPSNLVDYNQEAELKYVAEGVFENLKPHQNIAVLHPGASAIYKRWPPSHFAKLSELLVQQGYFVVWIGSGESDSNAINEIRSLSSQSSSLNLCNQLSYAELIGLLKASSLYIGADSGPMHLAASTGLSVLGLFGPSKESIWRPLGGKSKVLRSETTCHENCRGTVCTRDTHCLTTLSANFVFDSSLLHTQQK